MTSSMVRRNGTSPMQPQAPQALQMTQIEPGTASALETVTGTAISAFHGAADGASIMAALDMAAAVNDLRALFDRPEIKARILALQDTPLGFRTDCDPKVKRKKKNQQTGQWSEVTNTPYAYEVVREAAIEALLRRLQLVGNQFNIIAGRFYCTKEGFEALIRQLASVTNFRPVIGVPQSKSGGVIIDCSATWTQNGETQSLAASIPVKADDYSGADQSIGKATRKFLKRCYECMTGNSMPEGDASELESSSAPQPVALAGAPAAPSADLPPAITAAAAPVATLTEQQIQQINTALERQLTPVGRAAFTVDALGAFGVEAFAEIPAEQHTALMQSIGNAGNRERWNRGCGHADGEPVLTAEQIADLTPDAAEPAPEPVAPAPSAKPAIRAKGGDAVTLTRAAAPAPDVAAQPEPEPEEGDEEGDDALQRELV